MASSTFALPSITTRRMSQMLKKPSLRLASHGRSDGFFNICDIRRVVMEGSAAKQFAGTHPSRGGKSEKLAGGGICLAHQSAGIEEQDAAGKVREYRGA